MAGWSVAALLALTAVVLSVVQPAVLLAVPLGLALLALPPRRPLPMALGAVLLVAVLPLRNGNGLASLERGWALMVGGWFVVASVLWPGRSVLARGLAAVAAAFASSLLVLGAGGGFDRVDAAVTMRLRTSASAAVAAWGDRLGSAGSVGDAVTSAIDLQAAIYPALLALASLAALGLAWWGQRRLTVQESQPLRPFREFRFPDALVWLLIAGVALLALPVDQIATRAGGNLLAFMGALYALRGLAVLWVMGSPGPLGLVLGAVAAVFLYPLVLAAAIVVGLSDTWLEFRTRRRASGPNP